MKANPVRPFTDQERKIADMIAHRGLAYLEIAVELKISTHTVRSYVRAMSTKIDGLDVLPPRTRIWMVVRHPDIAEAIRAELIADAHAAPA